MRSTLSLRSFPNIAFETIPVFVWLTVGPSGPFKKDCLVLPLSKSCKCKMESDSSDCLRECSLCLQIKMTKYLKFDGWWMIQSCLCCPVEWWVHEMFAFRQAVTGYVPVASLRGKTSGKLVKHNILSLTCHRSLALSTIHTVFSVCF